MVPKKSKKKYKVAYNLFLEWCQIQETNSYSENVLMAYFGTISSRFKASTLWAQYSMLKTMLNIYKGVDISNYLRLRAFLKRKSEGYQAKKSKVFTTSEIDKFIKEAPDSVYLLAKVVLIMGIMGASRRDEIYKMKLDDLEDLGTAILVKISRTTTCRRFTITGKYYDIVKKYWNMRPTGVIDNSFFVNYQQGKCTIQKIGINKIGNMGKQIAKFLRLQNPDLYTGHCFRRSSATVLVDSAPCNPQIREVEENHFGSWGYFDT